MMIKIGSEHERGRERERKKQADITVGASLPKLLRYSFWKKWKNLRASRKACSSSFSTTDYEELFRDFMKERGKKCYGSCAIRLSLAKIALWVEWAATSDGIMAFFQGVMRVKRTVHLVERQINWRNL